MAVTTTSKLLLNSTRPDALLVHRWAEIAAANGGSFSVVNSYDSREGWWISTITITWPDGIPVMPGAARTQGASQT